MSYVLTMTDRGVVTLPAKLRRELGLSPNQPLLAEVTAGGVLLRPAATLPIEVYSAERVAEFDQAEAALAVVLAGARK
jgi:antitoxin PrlF